jgi:hypothetical protein
LTSTPPDSGFHETEPVSFESPTDLPWFLQDARPSGFLGRAWARAHAGRGWPADPGRWTGDDVLRYATRYGTDLPGAFVVGDFAREQLERRPDRTAVGDVSTEYPLRAARALSEAPWASSAGGEQPKFAVAIADEGGVHHRLVKFSPPLETPGGRRWADLLVVEHLVHQLLRDRGIAAASSRIVDAGGRRFLDVDRFDRYGGRG